MVNTFRVIFLTAVFAFSMLFLVQNSQILDTEASLLLDLWWVKLSSPDIAFYVFVFICFIAGLVFGVFAFFPGNRYLREKLRPIKAKTKKLRGEIIAMQKKEEEIKAEEIIEQQKPADQSSETLDPKGKIEEPVVHAEKSGSAAGKIALAGVVVLFIVIAVFYFYAEQKFQEFQTKVDMTMQNSLMLSETMEEVNNNVKKELSTFTSVISEQEKQLETHEEMLDDLHNLPQKTMDYLTFMLMKEYSVKIDQLMENAGEEDQQMLQDVLESLDTALEHYRLK